MDLMSKFLSGVAVSKVGDCALFQVHIHPAVTSDVANVIVYTDLPDNEPYTTGMPG